MKSDQDLLYEIDMICKDSDDEDKLKEIGKPKPQNNFGLNVKPFEVNEELFNVSNIQVNGKAIETCEENFSLHENVELNEIYQYLNSSDHKDILSQITNMGNLIKEDEQVLDFFSTSIQKCATNKEMIQYFEAMHYEDKIRIKHEREIMGKITEIYKHKMKFFNDIRTYTNRLYYEVKLLKNLHEIKRERHGGTYKDKKFELINPDSDIYDWIVDIDLITKISTEGWMVSFSKNFQKSTNYQMQKNVMGGIKIGTPENKIGSQQKIPDKETSIDNDSFLRKSSGSFSNRKLETNNVNSNSWEGAIVAVVGLYDKGKTFVQNNISFSNLPSGKKVNTKGLSFKYVNIDEGTKLIIQDTAGSYSPVKVENNMSIIEKEATEMFILDLVFEISDYFLFVVNDFTSLDQRYLDKLTRSLQNSPSKGFREVIVIHNFKEVENQDILSHIWETQVKQIYSNGSEQFTKVAARNPLTGKLEEKTVSWFKSPFTRHVCLVNQDSIFGYNVNPWSFSLIRYWLKAVQVPLNRNFSVVDNVIHVSETKLSYYFKTPITLSLVDTDDFYKKKITKKKIEGALRLPQLSIDSSGLVLTRPDSFLPAVDIIKGDQYCIYMDLPGIDIKDIQILRNNVTTIVKGKRQRSVEEEGYYDSSYEKNERKFGEFTLTFKIPEMYERKWESYDLVDGVQAIIYNKDNDDYELKENIEDIDHTKNN